MINLRRILLYLSAFFAAGMLFFTFFTLAWYSDANGLKSNGWEIPVGFNKGTLSTVADCIWMAAPFFLLFATVLFFHGKGAQKLGTVLSSLPLIIYAVLRFPDLMEEDVHGTLLLTVLGLFIIGAFCIVAVFIPETRSIAPALIFSYMGLEILLLILSFAFQEKYSYFYFHVDTLLFDRTMVFRYTYVVISVFLYHIFYALSLGLRMLPVPEKILVFPPKEAEIAAEEAKEKEDEDDEDDDDDYSSLTLEDLGIQR